MTVVSGNHPDTIRFTSTVRRSSVLALVMILWAVFGGMQEAAASDHPRPIGVTQTQPASVVMLPENGSVLASTMPSASTLTGDMRSDLAASRVQDDQRESPAMLGGPGKKNPVVTGLMSLAVPGAGQFYTGNYLRAALYFAAEVAGITAGIIYNNKGDVKTNQFQDYADAHWSAVKYAEFLNTYAAKYRTNKDAAHIAIDPNTSLKPWQRVDFYAINAYEDGPWSDGFSHKLPQYGEQQYYELIGKYDQFKYGWDTYPVQANGYPADDNGYDQNVPQQLLNYAADRGKANDLYATSRLAIGLVVVNHFVSAVDGYLAARHYNAQLASNMSLERVGGQMALTSRVTLAIGL